MSETSIWPVFVLCAIAFLTLGILGGHIYWPQINEVTKEVTVEVPIEKTVEVIKEVPVETIIEVPAEDGISNLLDKAKAEFLDELADEDTITCNGTEYDADQATIRKIYDGWSVSYEDDTDDDTTDVDFTAKVKFVDTDTEEKCYDDYSVSVTFHSDSDENTDVSY